MTRASMLPVEDLRATPVAVEQSVPSGVGTVVRGTPLPEALPGTASGECTGGLCAHASAAASEPLLPEAQRRWAARPLPERLAVIRVARHWIAEHPESFAKAISSRLARSHADTLVSEVLPLLEAMRFLERQAEKILAPRLLGTHGRPVWLAGVQATIHREPFGQVAVLAPANFPLFLPGVQVLQALAAGNAVTWKPGDGGRVVALLLSHVLREAGLPRGVLHVTEESAEAGQEILRAQPDKVILTGSQATGQKVLAALARTTTPATMELSGADAVVVLPTADLRAAAQAIAFGLRLNGSEICMSPRRLVATTEVLRRLRPLLHEELAKIEPVALAPSTAERLKDMLHDAVAKGAAVAGTFEPSTQRPLLVDEAVTGMAITQSDIFAPVLSVLAVPSVMHIAEVVNRSPMKLTAAIFGNVAEAETLAQELRVGTVLINDLIAPTADPRVPFGGRDGSGFGVTRGTEGLLEMTVPKVVLRRRKVTTRHYAPQNAAATSLFASVIACLHGGSLAVRWQALQRLIRAARASAS